VPSDFYASDFCAALFRSDISTLDRWMSKESFFYWLTGQSGGTPDSPVNYSRARLQILESGWFGVVRPGAPDSPVRHFSAHSGSLLHF
jgi:hypothetical protein